MSWINAEDIPEDEFSDLSETSSQSQFRFENVDDDDSEYLPSSFDPSSQEFSQVINQDWISEHVKAVIGSLSEKIFILYFSKDKLCQFYSVFISIGAEYRRHKG